MPDLSSWALGSICCFDSPSNQRRDVAHRRQPITTTAAIAGVKRDAAELTMGRLSLGRATPSDLPFIMETERLPGFDKMVGRWTADQHKAAYSKPSYAYLLGTEIGGEAFGFAIIRDLDDPHGNVCLKRIAIASPGRGYGTPFLGMVLDWVFREATAYRVWLVVCTIQRIHESVRICDTGPLLGGSGDGSRGMCGCQHCGARAVGGDRG